MADGLRAEKPVRALTPEPARSIVDARGDETKGRALATRLRRAARIGPAGIADRARQELRRAADRLVLEAAPGVARSSMSFPHLDPRPPPCRPGRRSDRERFGDGYCKFRHEFPERFFAGAGEAATAGFLASRFPESCARVLARAGDARAHVFTLMGRKLQLGAEPIDWHRDAVSGNRAPLVHWSRIDTLDYASVGDSKITWELNRHQWLIDLAQAYRLTGDETHAETALAQVEAWTHANPRGIGINWASSLEVAFRLIAWCWMLALLADSRALTAIRYEMLLGWIRSHAAHVEKYLSRYFSPNTHLTGEALGLVYAGTLFPALSRAARWRRLGARVLLRQLPRQVFADGVYFEQSTCYARYTAEIYLHFFLLAKRNGVEIPGAAHSRLRRLIDFLLAIRHPDGSLPAIGDADGGRLLPLVPRSPADCRDVFAIAAAYYRRPDYARAATSLAPELLWLLGAAGRDRFERLAPSPPAGKPSKRFPHGGWVVMRSDWGRDAHQLVFDVGPLGCPFSGGHGHADLLSIQCATFGEARLGDPGSCCYTADAARRDYFRGSRAHSTVVVDDEDQAEPAGCFSWVERPQARLNRWDSSARFDFADAEHHAYTRLADAVVHRRRVLFVKPRYWLVVDDVTGLGRHRFDLVFQFESAGAGVGRDGWAHCAGADGRGLCLRAWATVEIETRMEEGQSEPPAGWASPDYGLRVPASRLRYTGEADTPVRLVTVLVPRASAHEALPRVSCERGTVRVDSPGGPEIVTITDEKIRIEDAGGRPLGTFGRNQGAGPCAA